MNEVLKFGTSGLRGLATELIDAAGIYTGAFLDHLENGGGFGPGGTVLIGEDLRASSPSIAAAVAKAIGLRGGVAIDCGQLPTPALALDSLRRGVPAVMVTGSHIPADRNGLKFYGPDGEIGKKDEACISATLGRQAPSTSHGPQVVRSAEALHRYRARYRGVLPPDAFAGWRVGVYQHSSVARDLLVELLGGFGAEIVPLAPSPTFIALDTEAVSAAVAAEVEQWVTTHHLDALVSTDGDADRPLLADNFGRLVRGDILGWLTARVLGADAVVTPVTSNSALETDSGFASVIRTRVGSPYVIEGLAAALRGGATRAVGFEANGGVLLGSDVGFGLAQLTALPTRDAMLPIIGVLAAARADNSSIAELVGTVPQRLARSGRLEHVAPERSAAFFRMLDDGHDGFFASQGGVAGCSDIDGRRFTLKGGDIIHYRASGNAPELRCYVEAGEAGRAEALLNWGIGAAASFLG